MKFVDHLAIDGNEPLRSEPFAPWPYFERDEIAVVENVLASGKVNYWTGQEGRKFEEEFASFVGCQYAIALANGTVALELALYALGIGPGDEVILTSRTFIASASCVVMRGATPVMADVDLVSQNVTADSIRAVLSPRTKAIIAVHLAGWPCEMDPILALANEYGLKVIEDCAQAHGATYKGKLVGSLGDVAAFSFCQDKIMTTGGEGGMFTTNDRQIWEKAWAFKDHGKSYDAIYNREAKPGFNWVHDSFGTNWRITEMQAAIGRVQLLKLPAWLETRRRNALILRQCFEKIPGLRVTVAPEYVDHAYYKFYTFTKSEMLKAGWDRDKIMLAIVAEGVPCFSGSCSEIYLEKAFPKSMRPPARLPIAKQLGETSLMFLVHPTLEEKDMHDICQAVEKVMRAAVQ
ncbi:DegT/DnrJ/EryC1/StrS family aminotransferase [Sulfurirhabdus autotrophica]|uniref:dTDP-4-amino-4,6-dideoxygalactose transaminase n=1 Tax=Sulfurirhabdus autotrophica TaxID=1706046 RepID=A0A4R3XZC7_9PROT|nr:DegT/DnrJ/EryC1/StrS family aminotransferase [Sulfurirhabdus autotrophica]TCV84281.1 hypothetical protein EDC63_11245 [Sulfurirhabdus autotrophica]